MKFLEITRYEFRYQATRWLTWVVFLLLLVIGFLTTRDGSLSEVLYSEFYLNSPFVIAGITVIGGIVWLLTAALITGDAAARDISTGIHPIMYAMPVSKSAYLGGRFLSVWLIHLILILALPLGNMLSVYLPGVHPELVGPFRPEAYLTTFFYISLPNITAAIALQFFLASRGGKPIVAYLGSLAIFFISYAFCSFLMIQGRRDLANIIDPVGVHFILSELSHLWTTAEKSSRLLSLEGTLLTNRIIWLSVAFTTLTGTFALFRFRHQGESNSRRLWSPFRRKARQQEVQPLAVYDPAANITVPVVTRRFGFSFQLRQLGSIAWRSFRSLAFSWAGVVLLVILPLLLILFIMDQMTFNGVPLIPTTASVLKEATSSGGTDKWIIIKLLIILFAGELIWKERNAGTDELTNTMPGSSWVPLLGKYAGIAMLLSAFVLLQMVAGMVSQSLLGYDDFRAGHYIKVLFGLQLPDYLLFAALALAIHVVVNNKYAGHFIGLIVLMLSALPWLFKIEHNMLLFGASPAWSYTEMRGFGGTVGPWLWFKLYWTAWAFLLIICARLLWVRGKENSFKVRLRTVDLSAGTRVAGVVAALLVLGIGGYVFYNTNVRHTYMNTKKAHELQAAYERKFGQYATLQQPMLKEADISIEIYPGDHRATIEGMYALVNQYDSAISQIHLATKRQVETHDLTFDRPAELISSDNELNHHIYNLATPLVPGDTLRLSFAVEYKPQGFTEGGISTAVMENGTYFTNSWLPSIGYQQDRQIINPSIRRDMGLPERPVINSLYDSEVWQNRDAGLDFKTGVNLTAVIGTAEGQVAIGPGILLDQWQENGRSYYKYRTDGPIGSQWDFFSANYDVLEKEWQDPASGKTVALKVYHHPDHTSTPERLARGAEASLEYYNNTFGPYEYGHLTLVEKPGSGIGMHAEASLISFSEGSALFKNQKDETKLDLPYIIMTHEMGHQWTVPHAFVEGAPVMTEGLAWYYGLKAIEHSRGEDQLRAMLTFMRRPYPYAPIRRGEPLLRGVDPYMAYRKAPFALYALSEYVGEKEVNDALATLLEEHNRPGATLATTLDLYDQLDRRTPDSLKYLLHDLFDVNTFWNLEVENVSARKLDNEKYKISLEVMAHKLVYDSLGTESEPQMDEWIDIGIFAPVKRGEGELSKPLYVKRHRIKTGKQTIEVTVEGKPGLAGIDPYHILDVQEYEDDDNIEFVKIAKTE